MRLPVTPPAAPDPVGPRRVRRTAVPAQCQLRRGGQPVPASWTARRPADLALPRLMRADDGSFLADDTQVAPYETGGGWVMRTAWAGASPWRPAGAVMLGAGVVAAVVTTLAKWLLVGRFAEGRHPLRSSFVWRNELFDTFYEELGRPWFGTPFLGTPVFNAWARTLGVKIGKGVWLESHRLPETGASIGAGAKIGPGSLMMRRESVPDSTRWSGHPIVAEQAQPVPSPAGRADRRRGGAHRHRRKNGTWSRRGSVWWRDRSTPGSAVWAGTRRVRRGATHRRAGETIA